MVKNLLKRDNAQSSHGRSPRHFKIGEGPGYEVARSTTSYPGHILCAAIEINEDWRAWRRGWQNSRQCLFIKLTYFLTIVSKFFLMKSQVRRRPYIWDPAPEMAWSISCVLILESSSEYSNSLKTSTRNKKIVHERLIQHLTLRRLAWTVYANTHNCRPRLPTWTFKHTIEMPT